MKSFAVAVRVIGGDSIVAAIVAVVVKNLGLKFRFQNLFSIHLFYAMNREFLYRINVLINVKLDSIVMQ